MKPPGRICCALVLLLGVVVPAPAAPAQAATPLLPLLRVGPWRGISALIAYRGRLWFANSEKFVNHNSADLYSYAPGETVPRYQRHLFSQDAGQPLVAGGLLYWPFEDARFSTGQGEYMVTNGRDWRWRVLPEGRVFHLHAMIANAGSVYAATSAWRAGLQRSDDLGRSWRLVYEYPTPPRRVSRFTSLGVLDGVVYAGLSRYRQPGVRLYRFPADQAQPQPGWPPGLRSDALTYFGGWLYAVNTQAGTSAVWRTDGRRVERVQALDGVPIQAFTAAPDSLWAVSGDHTGGHLWHSKDGIQWRRRQGFGSALPLSVAMFAGQPYVGTLGPGNRGTLWGPARAAATGTAGNIAQLPGRAVPAFPRKPLPAQLKALDLVLAAPAASFRELRRNLSAVLDPLARECSAKTGAALAARLGSVPAGPGLNAFGGKLQVQPRQLKQWYLLRAIALCGSGRIPPALLQSGWREAANDPEKYFHPLPAALWAAGQLRQDDDATVEALVSRLGTPGEPAWLDGDRIGALTAISGQRFGYDRGAWRRWWAGRSPRPRRQ